MPFSLSSYLLGVGTVLGALAFGFGGGVVLTKTAMQASPPTETRVERVARADPLPSTSPAAWPQTLESANATPATPPTPLTPEAPAPTSAAKSVVDGRNENANAAESVPLTEAANVAEQSKKSTTQSAKPAEPKESERRKSDRKLMRQKHEVERKARELAARADIAARAKADIEVRSKQRQFEQAESPDRVFASERQESRPNFFEFPLFGRSRGSPWDED